MQTDVYIKIFNEKMNIRFWMAGFLVIPKVYAVIASPFSGSGFPPSLIPALLKIGILHHKKAELRILLQQSVHKL